MDNLGSDYTFRVFDMYPRGKSDIVRDHYDVIMITNTFDGMGLVTGFHICDFYPLISRQRYQINRRGLRCSSHRKLNACNESYGDIEFRKIKVASTYNFKIYSIR